MWIQFLSKSKVRIQHCLSEAIPMGSNFPLREDNVPMKLNISFPALVTTTTARDPLSPTQSLYSLFLCGTTVMQNICCFLNSTVHGNK